MLDEGKSRQELLQEVFVLRRQIASLEEDLQGTAREQSGLSRKAALAETELLALTHLHDLQALLDHIARVATDLFPASGGASLVLWDGDDRSFFISSSTVPGQTAETGKQRVRRRGGATRWIVENREPLIVPDVRRDPIGANPMLAESGLRAYVGVPLLAEDQVLGVLYALDLHPREYADADIEFLSTLADRAAVAILNARLFGQVQELSQTDELTGLHTRRHFFHLADHEFSRHRRYRRPLSAIMLDVDHFKDINDRHGHLAGDHVLHSVAERCKALVREIDILGRYGGDEIAIVLPEASVNEARRVAERIQAGMDDFKVQVEDTELAITLSMGVAMANRNTPNLAALLERADSALYTAKESGRNRIEVLK